MDDFAEGLEDGVVEDGGEEEVDVFQVDSVVVHLLLQLYLVLVA